MKRISWVHVINRDSFNWLIVSVFTFIIGAVILADMLKKPYNFFVAVGLLLAGIVWVIVMLIKIKQTEVVEKILYNLTIDVKCHKRIFDKTRLHSVEDQIEMYGLAIYRAKKYLKGNWKVTEKGYLIRGFAQDVENRTAVVDIDDVTPGLLVLERVLAGKEQMREGACRVHLHFNEDGCVMNVGVNGNGLYLN